MVSAQISIKLNIDPILSSYFNIGVLQYFFDSFIYLKPKLRYNYHKNIVKSLEWVRGLTTADK